MIGRAVCPLYQKKIVLPTNDKMEFDIELLPNTCGTLVVQQTDPSSGILQRWWKNLLPSQIVLATLVLYILLSDQWLQTMTAIAPSVTVFYTVRTLVDRQLGLNWLRIYKYLP